MKKPLPRLVGAGGRTTAHDAEEKTRPHVGTRKNKAQW